MCSLSKYFIYNNYITSHLDYLEQKLKIREQK